MQPYKSPYEACIDGMRKGWDLVVRGMLPNMMLAFVLMQILAKTGLLDLIGISCGWIMSPFNLPGEAITVLLSSWLSIAAGVGTAANLYFAGTINSTHLVLLLPGMYLLAAQIQYIGRLLAVAGIPPKYYPAMCCIGILNAIIGMFLAKFLI